MAHEVEAQTPGGSPQQRAGGVRPRHTLAVVAVGVIGVLIAFWVLSSIASLVAVLVKVVVLVAVIAGLFWLLVGRHRHR
ncbi:MAG: hypothetical protein M0Z46_13835 [Actinomycetota bacterium]|jgi:Flp pilus assembly protein TadB|nr:hypothetical protein [Actinomycetota bacterium]